MDKIYEQAKDLHVVATVIYIDPSAGVGYKDKELTKLFAPDEFDEIFTKGATIVDVVNKKRYNPTGWAPREMTMYYINSEGEMTSVIANGISLG